MSYPGDGSVLNLELDSGRQAPVSSCLSPHYWNYRHAQPHLASYVGFGDLNSGPWDCTNGLVNWSTVLAPELTFFLLFLASHYTLQMSGYSCTVGKQGVTTLVTFLLPWQNTVTNTTYRIKAFNLGLVGSKGSGAHDSRGKHGSQQAGMVPKQ